MGSIRRRLLLSSLLVLAVFLGGTAIALDRAYRDSAEGALRARLKTEIFALLSAAELRRGKLELPQDLPESRLEVPGSGRYAEVSARDGKVLWRSPSSVGLNLPFVRGLAPGRESWTRVRADGETLLAYSLGVGWEVQGGAAQQFTFSTAARLDELAAEIGQFETTLMLWLGGAAGLLLLTQMLILGWGLRPLRQVAGDLHRIERGERDALGGPYPAELLPLTDGLNALLRHERAQLLRQRNALADLAHSIKTPLAVLRNAAAEAPPAQQRLLTDAVDAIDASLAYQARRAAASGRSTLSAAVPVAQVAGRVMSSLDKVYADKAVAAELDDPQTGQFAGDEGDLYELLGCLLDNAYKWCERRVWLSVQSTDGDGTNPRRLDLILEDDGPGVPPPLREAVLERGTRADRRVPGQGIGLAVVRDIAIAYGGRLDIDDSPRLGGARVTVRLPGA
ncbi:MAG TPA: ATP-binding protein [Immundisolibacter sp.]